MHEQDEKRPRPENPEVHHETSDVNARGVFWFIGIFIVFAIVAHVAIGIFYWWLEKKNYESQPAPVTLVRGAKEMQPAGPRLQPFPSSLPPFPGATENAMVPQTPRVEMSEFRQREDAQLRSYGWVDRQRGIVHIPIETAIDLAAQQNFPVRQMPGGAPGSGAQPAPVPSASQASGAQRAQVPSQASRSPR